MNIHLNKIFILIIAILILTSCFGQKKKKSTTANPLPQFTQVTINNTLITNGVMSIANNGTFYHIAYNNNIIFTSTNLDFTEPWITYNTINVISGGHIIAISPNYSASTPTTLELILLTDQTPPNNVYLCSNIAQMNMSCAPTQIMSNIINSISKSNIFGNNSIQYALTNMDTNAHLYMKNSTDLSYNEIFNLLLPTTLNIFDANVDINGVLYLLIPSPTIEYTSNLYSYNSLGRGWTLLTTNDNISAPIAADYQGNVFYTNTVGSTLNCTNNQWVIPVNYLNESKDYQSNAVLSANCQSPISVVNMNIDSVNNLYISVLQNGITTVYTTSIRYN